LLYTGVFPDCLKIAVVKPVYKKGDKNIMENYKLISLFTLFSKVLKKAMHSRLSPTPACKQHTGHRTV
jgi:hypothetical protein